MVVISYDIQSAQVRRRVVKVLAGVGRRVQKSVWESRVEGEALAQVRRRLARLIQPGDSVRYYPLCLACYGRLVSDGDAGPAYREAMIRL
ncbi:MAG: CRISPR-associated endonuclease Cas2 [bacterium]|nr:CRISPR-associated endonuclease Cas2 [bacterium]